VEVGKRLEKYGWLQRDTWEREQIIPRDRELVEASYPHFPDVEKELLEIEAEARDRFIRHYLRLSSVEIWRRAGRDNDMVLEFGHGPATPAVLSRLEAAIAAKDPWRFQKAWGAISFEEKKTFVIR
jgi:hypothetical protein